MKNIPNMLTMGRIVLIIVFDVLANFNNAICHWIAYIIAIIGGLTDLFDGYLARKYHCESDFGRLIDPLADKFMVFGAMLAILYKYDYLRDVFIWAALIVIFRELAITSMRLIISSSAGKVVAAAWLGKVKTVTQIVCILAVLLEPLIPLALCREYHVLAYATTALMAVMTVWSGVDYFKVYGKYIKMD